MIDEAKHKSGRWIPWMIVAFFVVVAILDGIFVYLATSTHTGVVTDQAYERGRDYNATVAAAEQSNELGWQGNLDLVAASDLKFLLADKTGKAITGARIRAELVRPTQDGFDFEVTFKEGEAGQYGAMVDFPLEGIWDVRVFVEWKHKQYQMAERLVVAK